MNAELRDRIEQLEAERLRPVPPAPPRPPVVLADLLDALIELSDELGDDEHDTTASDDR